MIIGNINAITYKEVFPLIKANKIWLGVTGFMRDMVFEVPEGIDIRPSDQAKAARMGYVGRFTRLGNSCWFTNIDHGRRHEPLSLMNMADNVRYNKKLKGREYARYDNYDAIEVPYTDAIPSDYPGVMGVPITFLDKYCPEQFEILGTDSKDMVEELGIGPIGDKWVETYRAGGGRGHITAQMRNLVLIDSTGKACAPYARILIRHRNPQTAG